MRCLTVAFAVLVLTLQASTEAGGQESDAPPPEMKPLEKLVGTWKIDLETKVPEKSRMNYTVKGEMVLGGRFLQQTEAFDDKGKPKQMGMHTYDSNRKTYRYWFFMSSGFFTDMTGTWDESNQTFTYTNRLPGGGRGTLTNHFLNENAFAFSWITKDARGEIGYHMEGKAVRQK